VTVLNKLHDNPSSSCPGWRDLFGKSTEQTQFLLLKQQGFMNILWFPEVRVMRPSIIRVNIATDFLSLRPPHGSRELKRNPW
jgi:hypothetical protein